MLFLTFQLGDDYYALDIAQVLMVLPLVAYKTIPQAPPGVAGLFTFRGAPVPLVDLTALALGRPSLVRMSTRIILVQYGEPEGAPHLLGLLAENATETLRRNPEDFTDSGVTAPEAPYLGLVTQHPRGMIQRVEIEHLLPPEVRDKLFRQPVEFS